MKNELMGKILIIVLAGLIAGSCVEKDLDENELCSVEATVVDLKSLDGCDFVFELKDGTRLLPERRTYIQAPTKEADPVYHYQFIDGKKVRIGFVESSALSTCMAGNMVFITCITE